MAPAQGDPIAHVPVAPRRTGVPDVIDMMVVAEQVSPTAIRAGLKFAALQAASGPFANSSKESLNVVICRQTPM